MIAKALYAVISVALWLIMLPLIAIFAVRVAMVKLFDWIELRAIYDDNPERQDKARWRNS